MQKPGGRCAHSGKGCLWIAVFLVIQVRRHMAGPQTKGPGDGCFQLQTFFGRAFDKDFDQPLIKGLCNQTVRFGGGNLQSGSDFTLGVTANIGQPRSTCRQPLVLIRGVPLFPCQLPCNSRVFRPRTAPAFDVLRFFLFIEIFFNNAGKMDYCQEIESFRTDFSVRNSMPFQNLSVKVSFYYLSLFLIVGIFVPFIPVWMAGRGLNDEQIGYVLAAALWAKLLVGPLMTGEIDQSGKRWRILMLIGFVSLAGLVAMEFATGFWMILLVWLVVGTLLTTAMPIADSLSLLAANRHGLNYGKVRRWGSIGFIVASVAGGWYLKDRSSEHILWLMIAGAVLLIVASWLLPDLKTPPAEKKRPALLEVLASPNFLLFVFSASLLQSSHAGLYGFASRHWSDAGVDEEIIGLLWAEGVVAEVLVFSLGAFLIKRLGPARLMMLAGAAGLVRWGVLSSTTDLTWLIAIQALHGLTFSGTHIAVFAFIQQNVPEEQSASAQGLFDSLAMGLFFGLSMAVAGWVYERATSDAFLMMTALSLSGGIGATLLFLRTRKI